jgi:hypothetical protein
MGYLLSKELNSPGWLWIIVEAEKKNPEGDERLALRE